MSQEREGEMDRSWIANAEGWTEAVRGGRIESRRLATDRAIVEAVAQRSPRRALDVGCGEGWLARALADRGMDVVGVDASAPLVEAARKLGGGSFRVLSYADLAADPASVGTGFDAAVFNFALLHEDAAPVLQAVRRILAPAGSLLIQTVHPWTARGEAPYRDGWRTETFAGFGPSFSEPMPWYFRTLESWIALLGRSGYLVRELREPAHPDTGQPLSLLLVGTPSA